MYYDTTKVNAWQTSRLTVWLRGEIWTRAISFSPVSQVKKKLDYTGAEFQPVMKQKSRLKKKRGNWEVVFV